MLEKLARWNNRNKPDFEKLVKALDRGKQDAAKKHTYISVLKMKEFRYKNFAVPYMM